MTDSDRSKLVGLAADVVSAFVSRNRVEASGLPELIASVHASFDRIASGEDVGENAPAVPAVSIKKSVNSEYIVCLEDGKKFKSLKRHLRTRYNMSPEEYRAKWGLPADYPMVAPAYAAARSELARKMGLGRQGRGSAQEPEPAPPQPTPAKRGRRKSA